MKIVTLIRHAQSQPDRSAHQATWALTDKGIIDCLKLAVQFQHSAELTTPALLLSSHEVKALQTGEHLAQNLEIEFGAAAIKGFEEQDRSGAPFFNSRAQFDDTIELFFKQTDRPVFGRESADQAAIRFHSALKKTAISYPDREVGIVSHGRVMTAFLNRFAQIDPFPFWKSLTMPAIIQIEWPEIEIKKVQLFE